MPRIGDFLPQVQPGGPAPQQQASPDTLVPGWRQLDAADRTISDTQKHDADEAAHGMGHGMEALGSALDTIGEHVSQSLRAARLTQAETQATLEIQQAAFTLKHGTTNPDGTTSPPPDPTQHVNIFNGKVKEISDRYKKTLDPAAYNEFSREFSKAAQRQNFEVQENLISVSNKAAEASLDDTIATGAETAANATIYGRPLEINRVKLAIADAQLRGVVDPLKAREKSEHFDKSVSLALIRRGIQQDPEGTYKVLTGKDTIPGVVPEERVRLAGVALQAIDRQLSKSLAAQAAADRQQAKAEKAGQKQAWSEAVQLDMKITAGKATDADGIAWLNKNFSRMDPNHLDIFNRRWTSEDTATTDTATYVELNKKAYAADTPSKQEQVHREADAAVRSQKIKPKDWDKIYAIANTSTDKDRLPSWFAHGKEYITEMLGGEAVVDQQYKQMQARMKDNFWEWAQQHPTATDDEARQRYQQLAKDGLILGKGMFQPKLEAFPGEVNTPADLKAAAAATKAMFDSGKMDKTTYKQQRDYILDMSKQMDLQGRQVRSGGH